MRSARGFVFCQLALIDLHLQFILPSNHQLVKGVSPFYLTCPYNVGLGWPRSPQQSNLQQLPISCGSIGILEKKTIKDHILSSKFSPPQATSIIQRIFEKDNCLCFQDGRYYLSLSFKYCGLDTVR